MLRFIGQFEGVPVLNLRSGSRIGTITEPIIDPNSLKIAAFMVFVRRDNDDRALFTDDIREISDIGLIIDSEDELHEIDDELVRLQELLDINFQLTNKKVFTQSEKYLGRINDYAINDESFRIMKMYVTPPKRKLLQVNDLVISRTMVVEVTDSKIVVKDSAIRVREQGRSLFGALTS